MAYDSQVSRSNVQALVPEDVASEIIKTLPEQSAALSLFRRATMSTKQKRMPVLASLPVAYFVDGDIGLKQTTELAWKNKYLNAEEIAVILPIPEAVLEDMAYDIWGEARPLLTEAIGVCLDAAIFFGTSAPVSWPTNLAAGAVAAGNYYARGTATQDDGGLAEDLNQVMGLVEADGFDVNGFVTKRTMRARLRSARDTTGQKLLDVSTNEIEGAPIKYTMPGLWPSGNNAAEMFTGDWTQAILAIRKDITWKILDQAVIQDGTGAIVVNLAQQDMVALRVVFRAAWQIANPATRENPTDSTRYPFAVLRSPAS